MPGSEITKIGEKAEFFYVIIEGRCDSFVYDPKKSQLVKQRNMLTIRNRTLDRLITFMSTANQSEEDK